jgi:hypothetical protein
MKNVKDVPLFGKTYSIQVHPFDEGGLIAFELNRDLRAHVLRSQNVTMKALDGLSADEAKRLEEAGTDAERSRVFAELVAPKIKKSELVQGAADFLAAMDPERMLALFKRLVKYTAVDGAELGNPAHYALHMTGNYKVVVPLMAAVIEHNDFLDLDASELLQIQAAEQA